VTLASANGDAAGPVAATSGMARLTSTACSAEIGSIAIEGARGAFRAGLAIGSGGGAKCATLATAAALNASAPSAIPASRESPRADHARRSGRGSVSEAMMALI